MIRSFQVLLAGCLAALAVPQVGKANVLPIDQDVIRLSVREASGAILRITVEVTNADGLAALDIPIQFGEPGDPIRLEGVTWSHRVDGWDFRHAAIDNENKTVILGLICELLQPRKEAYLRAPASPLETSVAELVFHLHPGYHPAFRPFRTELPTHELSLIYNLFDGTTPDVVIVAPKFEVDFGTDQTVLPSSFALSQNAPNPFNPATSFTLSLPEPSDYQVNIYNITGQLVRMFSGHLEAGDHVVLWDGRNSSGTRVASGVYFYSAEAGSFTATRRMILLK